MSKQNCTLTAIASNIVDTWVLEHEHHLRFGLSVGEMDLYMEELTEQVQQALNDVVKVECEKHMENYRRIADCAVCNWQDDLVGLVDDIIRVTNEKCQPPKEGSDDPG